MKSYSNIRAGIRPPRKQLSKMRTLVIGCGDVGLRLLTQKAARHRIIATCRRPEQATAIRELGAIPLTGDLTDPRFQKRLTRLAASRVAYLAPPAPEGKNDKVSLRLSLQLNARGLTHQKPSVASLTRPSTPSGLRVCYVSTTGVYGDNQGQWIDETRTAKPKNPRAIRRVHAENCWRGKNAHQSHLASFKSVGILRAPGIYALERLPLERLRSGTPAIMASEDSWSNHIHADDLARLAWRSLFMKHGRRVFNAVDDEPTKMGDYFDTVADHFGLQRPERKPRQEVRSLVSPMMWSFMNESRRIRNQRLKELKIRLNFPSVSAFLSQQGEPHS